MKSNTDNTVGDIIDLNAKMAAARSSDGGRRETTLQQQKVLLTDQTLPRFVEVKLNDERTMKVATSPREIEWSACAQIHKDNCLVIAPWRGAEQGKKFKIGNNLSLTLPYPVMGVRAAGIREMAFMCENPMRSTRLPQDQSGPRRSMVPRDRDDKTKPLKPWRTYPVCTESFVKWFSAQEPVIFRPGVDQVRSPTSWMLIAETMGPWGRAIGEDWITFDKTKGGE